MGRRISARRADVSGDLRHRGNKILYIQYTNPAVYPALEHSSRMLAERGWKVVFLGIDAPDIRRFSFRDHPGIEVRLAPAALSGWGRELHYLRFCTWAAVQASRFQPDWIYASDPLGCGPALAAARLSRRSRLAYHEHDSPDPEGEPSAPMRRVLGARRRVAKRARLVVAPNEARAHAIRDMLGDEREVHCVWNCPESSEVGPARPAWDKSSLWVGYHGSLVPARLPETMIEALASLPDAVRLRVVGYETVGHPGYAEELFAIAARFGVSDRVEYLGTVPTREDLLEVARGCDVGLSLMPIGSGDINARHMTGASNKPFDYLASGAALLVSDLPDWRSMFVDPGYGQVCDPRSAESIAWALRWFLDHPVQMRAMGEEGRKRVASEWNYEHQFEPVLRELTAETQT